MDVKNEIPNIIKALIIGAIAITINFSIQSYLQSPEIDVTMFKKNLNDGVVKVDTIIYNPGKQPATNLLLVYNSNSLKLDNYNSSGSIPEKIEGRDGKLRIKIERLAPNSFVIITASGILDNRLDLWASHDKGSINLQLPTNNKNSVGITSINTLEFPRLWSLIGFGIGILLFSITRYHVYRKSESLRKIYLGFLDIKLVRAHAGRISIAFAIIVIGLIVANLIDNYYASRNEVAYYNNKPFDIKDTETFDKFIQLKQTYNEHVYQGTVFFAVCVIIAIIVSYTDIKYPSFIWLLRPTTTSNVLLNKIKSSYLLAKPVHLLDRVPDSGKQTFFVIKNNSHEIVALMNWGEIVLKDDKNPIFSEILESGELDSPTWDGSKRDNFIIVDETNTSVGLLKTRMEESLKKYAIIVDSENNVQGVIDYQTIFG